MVDHTNFGFQITGSHGPVTKYEKNTENGTIVVYQGLGMAVKVSEINTSVAIATEEFFWTDELTDGQLREISQFDRVEEAHRAAQEEFENSLAS